MKSIQEIKTIIKSHRKLLESKYYVKDIGVFGSFVKRRQKENSDIDILVTFKEPVDFIQFLQLEKYLSDLLQSEVDLVTKNALKPYIGKSILEEVVYL